MSKKIKLSQRINAGFALAMVFLLVLATNRIDQKHFETAQNAINTVFKDRVVAQDYIYQMSTIISDKKLQVTNSNYSISTGESNKAFEKIIRDFGATEMTIQEAKQFGILQNTYEKLKKIELSLKTEELSETRSKQAAISQKLDEIQVTLDRLATIQVVESKNLTSHAQKSLDMTSLISKLEIALLIIAGIAIQFVIFYQTKKVSERRLTKVNE